MSIITTSKCACCHTDITTGDLCREHAAQKLNIEVLESMIVGAGRGLFSMGVFKPRQKICQYKGEYLTSEELEKRYPGDCLAPYVAKIQHDDGVYGYIDARISTSCFARFVNSASSRGEENACLEYDGHICWLVALDPIQPSHEIIIDYGEEFFIIK